MGVSLFSQVQVGHYSEKGNLKDQDCILSS